MLPTPPPYMLEPQATIGNLQIDNTPVGVVGDVKGTAGGIDSLPARRVLGLMWRRRNSHHQSTLAKESVK
jgi:hypothetical protein